MLRYLKKEKRYVFLIAILSLILSILNVVQGIILQIIIDTAVGELNYSFAIILVVIVVYTLSEYFVSMLFYKTIYSVSSRSVCRAKDDMITSILNKYAINYKNGNMEIVSRIDKDIEQVLDKYFLNIFGLAKIITGFIIAVSYLLYVNVTLTLVLLVLGLSGAIIPNLFVNRSKRYKNDYLENNRSFLIILKEILYGLTTIQLFGVSKNFANKFHDENNKLEKSRVNTMLFDANISVVGSCIGFLVLASNVVFAGYLSFKGFFTVGTVLAVMQVMNYVVAPLTSGPILFAQIRSMKNVNNGIINIIEDNDTPFENKTANISIEKLNLCNISKQYQNSNSYALQDISFQFKSGHKYAVVGKSGCGKSTLLKIIALLEAPTSGSLTTNNITFHNESPESWRKKISFVQQDVYLFKETLYFNLTLGTKISDCELAEVLEKVALKEFVNTLPLGLNTIIDEGGNNLSGGEKQRISLARSMIKGSEILLVDEVTSSLDSRTAAVIESLILSQPQMVIMVTHKYNINTMNSCDAIIVMSQGQIIEVGTYDELSISGELFPLLLNSDGLSK